MDWKDCNFHKVRHPDTRVPGIDVREVICQIKSHGDLSCDWPKCIFIKIIETHGGST